MFSGAVSGVVVENRDPEGMHRVKVRLPVDGALLSTWCRVASPMAGAGRGLVILPDVGSEVLVMFSGHDQSPVVMGALFNGAQDAPEPYHNDDQQNHLRVFWSRSSHLLVFDDTPGAEKLGLGACAGARLDVSSGPVHHVLDAAQRKITEYCEGSTVYEATGKLSVRCASLKLEADRVLLRAQSTVAFAAPRVSLTSGAVARVSSSDTQVKTGGCPATPVAADVAATAAHPPSRA